MPEEYESIPHIVLDVVCRKFGVSKLSILGESRTKTRTLARQVVYYILREEFDHSYPEIGLAVNKDHTSVMNSIPKMKSRLKADKEFKSLMDETLAEIRKIRSATGKTKIICVGFPQGIHRRLQKLLQTGLYGSDLGDVVERLVCQQLQGLKVSK